MHKDRDDDALSWGGDDDPTLDTGAPAPGLPAGFTAAGKGSQALGDAPAAAPAPDATAAAADVAAAPDEGDDEAQLSNAALIGVGVLGGVYLLYTLGWILGGLRLQGVARFLVADAAFAPFHWFAVAAPALWFVTVFLLTRTSATWVRFAWLIGGALLLVPWPLLMIGVVA
ncbi:DNA polymerase III subunit gamma/tau [Microbacterium sp. W1N]|uniref:DNA polymerase III subunit gamma/tau n=1 Tax=Microbacterium festucae TaxID=2977531 RepID=UPI0021C06BE8|nr:DNA polymerase III subunit gamma/tau [Microbacterium festucae]MCT9820375.1 DNA polymerase III subunit gamma/tau [Microbacterium festucae]